MLDINRLSILTSSAKYDVSCSSSGSSRQNQGGLGNASLGGICHSFTADGRCISLLKILMTNDCIYDCQYCVNRRSNDTPRATATPDEICQLVISFYKRNYIEGLFLSSAITCSPNKTMELLFETVYKLRKKYNFYGYIHLKGIPSADKELIEKAGRYADRMSFNIELPSEKSLKLLAPQKNKEAILQPMKMLASEYIAEKKLSLKKFLPAGQTTQMIVGASPESDGQILRLTQNLYNKYKLKRVYYSSYVPVNTTNPNLPITNGKLLREHRLYQADWLLRFYGFTAEEIVDDDGFLEEGYDPKCAWALRNLDKFPVEVNTAPLELLVRVPGIGIKTAYRIKEGRKWRNLDFDTLKKMRVVIKRAKHFITASGKFFGEDNDIKIKKALLLIEEKQNARQLSLFNDEIISSVITGQL